MSLHRSLRSANAMARHRNVLTRVERLEKLEKGKRWKDEESVFGLPKVRSMKIVSKKKKKKDEEAATEAAAAE